MPKIIENLEHKLLEEAKRQIETQGYSATTIRSVAKACGVGVGTVYNYFPSKDALIASFMLEDWNRCMDAAHRVSAESGSAGPVVRCLYDQLRSFAAQHQAIFRDEGAGAAFAGSFSRYHALLRTQLAAPLHKFCSDAFCCEFIAESLLTWTMAGKEFDELYGIIGRLL